MEDTLIQLLQSLGYPVRRQGSFAPEEKYPDTFITFWCSEEVEHSSYNNDTQLVDYTYQVNVYSTSPNKAYAVLGSARVLLRVNGWTIAQRGYDAASGEATHTGRGMVVMYLKTEH